MRQMWKVMSGKWVAFALLFFLAAASGFAQEEAEEAPAAEAATEEVAEEPAVIDSGDTAFMFASTALVLLMTPRRLAHREVPQK